MGLSATVTVATKQEVEIKPAVRTKLLRELRAYAELKAAADQLKAEMQEHAKVIDAIRDEVGETSLKVDGFSVTLVAPVRSTLDPKKLIAQGVTTAQIEAATVTRPTRPYTKITVPGGRDED